MESCTASLRSGTIVLDAEPVSEYRLQMSLLPVEIMTHVGCLLREMDPIGRPIRRDAVTSADDGETHVSSEGAYNDSESKSASARGSRAPVIRQTGCSRLGWARLTHVNSRLRAVLIDFAALWKGIPLDLSIPFIDLMVKRAKDHALDVALPCIHNRESTVHVLESYLHRTRSLTVEVCSEGTLAALIAHTAPVLEKFVVHVAQYQMLVLADIMAAFPRLTSLTLPAVYRLSWKARIHEQVATSSRIKELSILSAELSPSLEDVLDVIQSIPQVCLLRLEDCLGNFRASAEPPSSTPISLPLLETLVLRGPESSCGIVLKSIVPPAAVSVSLYIMPDIMREDDTENTTEAAEYMHRSGLAWLMSVIDTSRYAALRVACKRAELSDGEHLQLVITAHDDTRSMESAARDLDRALSPASWSGQAYVRLNVVCILPNYNDIGHFEESVIMALNMFENIMEILPLASLTFLSLSMDTPFHLGAECWPYTRWILLLRQATHVKHLQLVCQSDDSRGKLDPHINVLLALCANRGGHWLMPALNGVSLTDMNADSYITVTQDGVSEAMEVTAGQIVCLLAEVRDLREHAISVYYPTASSSERYPNTAMCPLLPAAGVTAPYLSANRGWVETLKRQLETPMPPPGERVMEDRATPERG